MHQPVMTGAIVSFLVRDPRGAYLDLTVGAGGHIKALSAGLKSSARLYGLDKDPEAAAVARKETAACAQTVRIEHATYADVRKVVAGFPDTTFDGVLLDLGLSSLQLDDAGRGFSFQSDGPLDMRFNQKADGMTAAEIIQTYSEQELTHIFRSYGEERQAARIAKAIITERDKTPIQTTARLTEIITNVVHPPYQHKACARIFMALRIAVNRELETLQQALPNIFSVVKQGGRLAVIPYHSLEDRIVKRFFQQEAKGCICPPELPVCVCGHTPSALIITRKSVVPDDKEIAENPRARSARLRVLERIAE